MLSLNDAFSEGDIKDWIERIDKIIPGEKEFFCEYKIDGLAFEVIYDKGLFKIGSTRGDGTVGEDVSQNLKTVSSIPLKIDGKSNVDGKYRELTKGFLNRKISVRGEIFISKKEFKKINRKREEDGLSSFANPRNVAAGSIRQLDPSV
ncbi:MAG: NAD-dependent DNA ligase LigA, partial [Minisyncoccales bacterium]